MWSRYIIGGKNNHWWRQRGHEYGWDTWAYFNTVFWRKASSRKEVFKCDRLYINYHNKLDQLHFSYLHAFCFFFHNVDKIGFWQKFLELSPGSRIRQPHSLPWHLPFLQVNCSQQAKIYTKQRVLSLFLEIWNIIYHELPFDWYHAVA